MKNYFLILFCLLIFLAKAQDDCEKFEKPKIDQSIDIKICHVYSKTNNAKTYKNYGVEILYGFRPFRKVPINFAFGLGFYDRTISDKKSQTGGFDASCWHMIVDINYRLKHLELPVYIELNLDRNKKFKYPINLYSGISFMYLTKGVLEFCYPVSVVNGLLVDIPVLYRYNYSFGTITQNAPEDLKPSLKYFFPLLNYKLNFGTSVSYKRLSIGIEFNYILRQFGAPMRLWPGINNLNPTGNKPNSYNVTTYLKFKL